MLRALRKRAKRDLGKSLKKDVRKHLKGLSLNDED